MDYQINDFIGVFKNALGNDECEEIIQFFEDTQKLNLSTTRKQHDNVLSIHKDNSLFYMGNKTDSETYYFSQAYAHRFVNAAWNCYNIYTQQYGVLSSLSKHVFYNDIKIQKNLPTQGYHVWHCENDGRIAGSRLLLLICYLNSVLDGGETEFLYQSRRIKPEQGTIIICPTGFTHTHRGNPPLSGIKYIMNGWIEFSV